MKYFIVLLLSVFAFLIHANSVHATTDDSSSIILFQLGTENMGVRKETLHDGVSPDYLALTNPDVKIENLWGGKLFEGNEYDGPGIIINGNGHWLVTGTNHGKPFLFFGVSFYSMSDDIWIEEFIYFAKIGAVFIALLLILWKFKKQRASK